MGFLEWAMIRVRVTERAGIATGADEVRRARPPLVAEVGKKGPARAVVSPRVARLFAKRAAHHYVTKLGFASVNIESRIRDGKQGAAIA